MSICNCLLYTSVFEVRDKDGKVLDTLTTDKNGHAESKELPICTYNEDGSFKEDIHYTVVETCLLYTSSTCFDKKDP